jgi:transcription elongation factor GreB
MNKAFVKESDNEDDEEALALAQAIPAGAKNYITPATSASRTSYCS